MSQYDHYGERELIEELENRDATIKELTQTIKNLKSNDIGDLKPFCNECGESQHIINNDQCTKCKSTDIGFTD